MIEIKKSILKDIDNKCFIYNILCIKTHYYYNILYYAFHIPLISISSIMTVLNSSIQNTIILNNCNIICNLLTALLLVINGNLKFNSIADDFKNYQIRFIKLQYDCIKLLDRINDKNEEENEKDLNELNEKIYNIKKLYDDIIINMHDIPSHICINVYKTYKDYPDIEKLPLILLSYKGNS